ncbi:MAG: hypothetical protein PUH82_00665 [Bacteroidales bacterium]|uniref:hypothetical protein n=1 Tax=Candidatus Cryptobacteroides sp. TaxID=2952915 RepID=UPI002A91BC64|nr:hypothetical protein [Candidatus Cryptobacteroides sp.]MCI6525775.1 hypothetical protein [Bacteroidales bacterium]MDD7134868.1 hypothetical protein [Bacteroidales bacterium]MDY5567121.1 hypothetical protein [Candidatus Cryptobacteroides sp.]
MFKNFATGLVCFLLALVCLPASAQSGQKKEDKEKKMDEFIQNQVSNLENSLKLETWQTFYVDSILNHDYRAMQDELDNLSSAKVSNTDIYIRTQDKWNEQIYQALSKVMNEAQWNKYLKMGAAREKKFRDKRISRAEAKQ